MCILSSSSQNSIPHASAVSYLSRQKHWIATCTYTCTLFIQSPCQSFRLYTGGVSVRRGLLRGQSQHPLHCLQQGQQRPGPCCYGPCCYGDQVSVVAMVLAVIFCLQAASRAQLTFDLSYLTDFSTVLPKEEYPYGTCRL